MSLEKTGVQAVIEGLGSYLSGMQSMQSATDTTSKAITQVANNTSTATAQIDSFGKTMTAVKKIATSLGIGALFAKAASSAMESEDAIMDLDAALKSTKGASRISRKALLDLANGLQKTTRFSDEQIIAIESMELRFTSIGGKIFPQVIKSALNLAQKFGSVQAAALAVGKAMEDTTGGATTLRREGVMLTDAQEKQIATYERLGQHEKAQLVILDAIEKGYGGLAEAAGTTTAGKLDILKNKFDDVLETLGGFFTPALGAAADALGGIIDSLGPAAPVLLGVAGAFGALAIFSGPLASVLAAVATGLSGLLVPLAVIGGAVVLFRQAWDDNFLGIPSMIQGIIDGIQPELKNLKDAVDGFFADLNTPPPPIDLSHRQPAPKEDPFITRLVNAVTNAGPIILMRLGQLLDSLRIPIEATFAQIGKNLQVALEPIATLMGQIDPTSFGYLATGVFILAGALVMTKVATLLGAVVDTVKLLVTGVLALNLGMLPLLGIIALVGLITYAAATNLGGFGDTIRDLGDTLTKLGPAGLLAAAGIAALSWAMLPGLLSAAFANLPAIVSDLATTLGKLALAFWANLGPLLVIALPIGLITAYFSNWNGFKDTVDGIGKSLRDTWVAAVGQIATALERIAKAWGDIIKNGPLPLPPTVTGDYTGVAPVPVTSPNFVNPFGEGPSTIGPAPRMATSPEEAQRSGTDFGDKFTEALATELSAKFSVVDTALSGNFTNALDTSIQDMSDWVDAQGPLIEGIGTSIATYISNPFSAITTELIGAVVAGFQGIVDILNAMSWLPLIGGAAAEYAAALAGAIGKAEGGPVEAGTLYRVGERGTEGFVPQVNGTIIPHNLLDSVFPGSMPMPGMAGNTTNNYYNSSSMGDINMNGISGTDDSIRRYSMLRAMGRIK